ncbi:hypothetical protein KKC17_02885 [Patescibacteria group bacterium]|nr:hypothetical protein [Patescibacteria group bacterium]
MAKILHRKLIILLLGLNCLKAAESEVARWQKTWQPLPTWPVETAMMVLLPIIFNDLPQEFIEPEIDLEPLNLNFVILNYLPIKILVLGRVLNERPVNWLKGCQVSFLTGYKTNYPRLSV